MVADAEGPALHGEVGFSDPKRCQSDGKILVGLATGLGSTGKPALTSPSYQQTRNIVTKKRMDIKNSLMVPN